MSVQSSAGGVRGNPTCRGLSSADGGDANTPPIEDRTYPASPHPSAADPADPRVAWRFEWLPKRLCRRGPDSPRPGGACKPVPEEIVRLPPLKLFRLLA